MKTRRPLGVAWKKFSWYVFLFAAYPVLALLANNITQVSPWVALAPLVISMAGAGLMMVFLYLWLRDWRRAAVLTSFLTILFFSYGHLYTLLKSITIGSFVVGRHRYMLSLWLILTIGSIVFVAKKPRIPSDFTRYLNVVALVLVCLPLVQLGVYQIKKQIAAPIDRRSSVSAEVSLSPGQLAPDIYYIVLDGYARADILQEAFDVDNRQFLLDLENLGFSVARCSQSNYNETLLSLTSTFNMEYLQSLPPYRAEDRATSWINPYLENNRVRELLEGLGYQTITFNHIYESLVWDDADIVYKSASEGILLNPFETFLLQTTPVYAWMDTNAIKPTDRDQANRIDVLYALEQLRQIPDIPGPKFVYVHLIIPHPPFVFGPNGEEVNIPYDALAGDLYTEENYYRGYRDSITFINRQMLQILPSIISRSRVPPIIVLASDHGADSVGGYEIDFLNLNAYYLPGASSIVYDTITPVNSFRVIFDTFFNGQYGLLPDNSYVLLDPESSLSFSDVPNTCK